MNRKKTKRTFAFALILLAASTLAAQKAYVYEVTGKPVIESATGKALKVSEGSGLAYDEYLITKADSAASLILDGTRVKIANDSALGFIFSGTGTDPHPTFVPAAGAVSFSFAGTAPTTLTVLACGTKVRSNFAVFTVYTAIDGSAVVSVTKGSVEMETGKGSVRVSEGESVELTVELTAEMTAEQNADMAPHGWSVQAQAHRDESAFDFKSWNEQKTKRFLEDPLAVLAKAGLPAETHCALYAQLGEPYAQATETWRKAADAYREALAGEDAEIIADARTNTLFPAQDARLLIQNEMRYHAQMASIIRRFSLERLFTEFNKTSPVYAQDSYTVRSFFERYTGINNDIDRTAANEPISF